MGREFPPYEYKALEHNRQIRLINLLPQNGSCQLQCSVEIVDLDNEPPFTALSYTHGPPIVRDEDDQRRYDSLDPVPLVCDGKELLIKPNLASALKRFDQLGKYGYYWIDAVCIDLENKVERPSQVRMMGDIYATAKIVLIWLGEEDQHSKVTVALMKKPLPEPRDVLAVNEILKDTCESVEDFLHRSYFHRVWTFQEALLAKHIDVLCGETEISWKGLEELLLFLRLSNWHQWLSRFQKSPLMSSPERSLYSTMKLRNMLLEEHPFHPFYFGNIAGGNENKDLIFGYLDELLLEMRLRSATDARDHFYALYGIVSRLCILGDVPNPLISPDYTKNVAEVYTANVKSLVANSKSLLPLSSVEDRSLRKRTDLPSWVPDVGAPTAKALLSHGYGDSYNVSKGSLPRILTAPNLETLSLVGYHVDTITGTGDSGNDVSSGEGGGPFEKSAALLLRMATTYKNGQDRVEVLWRTLIADLTDSGCIPAHEQLGSAFREHLLVHNSVFLLRAQNQGHRQYQVATQRMEPLMTLAKSTPEAAALIPSLEETLRRKDIYAYLAEEREKAAACDKSILSDEAANVKFSETQNHMVREEAKIVPYGRRLVLTLVARRIFLTENGLLGLGPQSLMAGDHIFVLFGARMPFLLRPLSLAEGSSQRYEMVGEAYIHGIMQGETLDRGQPKLMNLQII
jgi:Heterokaryon incompatibility protein (HET)